MQQFTLTFILLSIFSVIAGGKAPAPLGQFPYHASIQRRLHNGGQEHMCSGAIVAPRWILTSASCYEYHKYGFVAITGTTKSHNATNPERQERHVVNVILHPDFDTSDDFPKNDIALVELTEALVYNQFVSDVELPKKKSTSLESATITGWDYIDGSFDDDLQSDRAPHISDKECTDAYPDRIPVKQQCYGPIQYSCLGHTGDPIVKNNIIRGIASYPQAGACDSEQYPFIYTDVLMYMDFIEEHIRK